MAEVEIGIGKPARLGYALDDVVIVPSRRTRDHEDVDVSWRLDAFDFALPFMAAPSDAVVSPATAAEIGRLGGVAVLDLEGLWARHDDPEPLFEELAGLERSRVTRRLQELYAAPLRADLVAARVAEIAKAGSVTCGAARPQGVAGLAEVVASAELEILVVRGTAMSAEHVSKGGETLDLRQLVRRLDVPVVVGGCVSYQGALHLMRTGAVAVLVGTGSDAVATRQVLGLGAPLATAIADAAAARARHLEETGVYVQVVADGGIWTGGDAAKAIACGADAVMLSAPLAAAEEAPGRGLHWASAAAHPSLPRGTLAPVGRLGTLEEILVGPGHDGDGRTNLAGALRSAMASSGYATLRELHKAEVMVAPLHGHGDGHLRL